MINFVEVVLLYTRRPRDLHWVGPVLFHMKDVTDVVDLGKRDEQGGIHSIASGIRCAQ